MQACYFLSRHTPLPAVSAELQNLRSSLTEEQVEERTSELVCQVCLSLLSTIAQEQEQDSSPCSACHAACGQVTEAQARLAELKGTGGKPVVTTAQRTAIEEAFRINLDHWARRRRMFRTIWRVPFPIPRLRGG